VLLGFRRRDQADWIASRLQLTHYVETQWNDWRAAADLGRELASRGQQLPLSDLLIAVIARRLNASVYTTDPHFDRIPDLRRFRP
jgi:predicted nucleic acid-binding protein